MDTDLSLIEITEEDDSLLQPILAAGDAVPSLAAANRSTNADYFFCSPLHVPRSNAKSLGVSTIAGLEDEAKSLFSSDGTNKENLNLEKAEALKLCVEPQQMKRKKKGSGFNPRNSLAWDRAFFTEEGFLDAAELSLIIGDSSKSNRQMLPPVIEESVSHSSNLQAFEDKLFENSVPTSSGKTKLNNDSLIPKTRRKEASPSVATRKVLSTHDVNRSGFKRSACPQPVASTSVKRPANVAARKATVKDTKVSKLPVLKPCPLAPALHRIGKNSTPSASDSKRSQIPRPVVYPQKNCRVKGSLEKSLSAGNSSKVSLARKPTTTKTSLCQAKRNVASSAKSGCSAMQSLDSEAKKGLGVISNLQCPSTCFPSNISDSESGKMTNFLPQTEKPTGLRRPSPSMGFFGQSKATPVQSPFKLTSQCGSGPESNISNPRKLGFSNPGFAPKPPLPPRSVPEKTNNDTSTGVSKASSSSYGCSDFPTLKPASSEKFESKSLLASMEKVERKPVRDEKGYGGLPSNADHEESTNRSLSEIPLVTSTAMKVTGPTKSDIANNELAENQPNPTAQADVVTVSTFEADLFRGSQMSPEIVADVGLSDKLETNAFSHLASATVLEKYYPSAHKLDAEYTGVQSLHGNFRVENSNSTVCCSVIVSDVTQKSDALERSGSFISVVEALQDEVTLHADNLSMCETRFVSEEAKQENSLIKDAKLENVLIEDAAKEYVLTEDAKTDNVLIEDATEDILIEEAKVDNVVTEDEKQEYILIEDAKLECVLINDAKREDVLTEEAEQEYVLTEDAMQKYEPTEEEELENILIKEAQLGNVLTKVATQEYLLAEDAKSKYVLLEEVKMENVLVEDAKQEDVLFEDTKQENALIEEADWGIVVSEDTKVANSLTEEPKKENALNYDAKLEHVLTEDVSQEYAPKDERERTVASEREPEISADPSLVPLIPLDCEVNLAELVECRSQEYCPADRTDIHNENPLIDLGNTADHQSDLAIIEFVNVIRQEISGIALLQSPLACGSSVNDTVGNANVESVKPDSPKPLDFLFPIQEDPMMDQVHESSAEEDEDKKTLGCVDGIEKRCFEADGMLFEKGGGASLYPEFNTDKESEKVKCRDENVEILFRVDQTQEYVTDGVVVGEPGQPLQVDNNAETLSRENDNNADMDSTEEELPCVKQLPQKNESELNKSGLEANSPKSDSREKQSVRVVSEQSTPDKEHEATRDCKKSGIERKQDNLVIKPPANAAPFSDEWLAALEAAGEEILTKKGGAVQNSPQDRSQPEPSPWSPVKRKHNQSLGPFDCTKHTNH